MLKDLKVALGKTQHSGATHQGSSGTAHSIQIAKVNRDAEVACEIVDHLFHYIDICLREDKSKVKISLFAKSFIRGMLTNNVRGGINDFLLNMNDQEVKLLLDDIQKELNKRYG